MRRPRHAHPSSASRPAAAGRGALVPQHPLFLLPLLAAAALAAPGATLVDGTEIEDFKLLDGDAKALRCEAGGQVTTVPASRLVSAELRADAKTAATGYNLHLRNGDRLQGKVSGSANGLKLEMEGQVSGLEVPLDAVKGVRFGRIVAPHLRAKYEEAFERELERGRDVVVAMRDAHPTPFPARVLEVKENVLVVRAGAERQELPADRVYGFVREDEGELREPEGLRVRLHLADGGQLTLPLERVTADAFLGGGARVARAAVQRVEFLGPHVGHLSDLDPIDVKETALFGDAPRWRRDGMVLGGPLRMAGKAYARGVGVQARSRLEFVLGGRWSVLFLRCGIDDAAGPDGDAVFRVLGDGKLLAETRRRRGEAPQALRLDVAGVDRLVLEALPGENWISDLCDWAEARVFLGE